jgi:hypothetical protein
MNFVVRDRKSKIGDIPDVLFGVFVCRDKIAKPLSIYSTPAAQAGCVC